MASPIAISPLSAAQILVSWIQTQGREPLVRECRPVNGLLFWRTFMDRIPGESFSAVVSAARSMVSAIPPPRMQSCLGPECDLRFPYHGSHFCSSCRAALGYDNDDTRSGRYLAAHTVAAVSRREDIAVVSQATLRAYGMDDHDEDDLRRDERVSGFDDLIASQMNSWQRTSRKRRFFEGR